MGPIFTALNFGNLPILLQSMSRQDILILTVVIEATTSFSMDKIAFVI